MAYDAKKQIVPNGTATSSPAGLRERKKARIRRELITAALDLYLERGFDNTRIDDIVHAVDISRRSFFRYFRSKDDIVLVWMEDVGKEILSELQRRPLTEPVWTSLEAILLELLRVVAEDTVRSLKLVTMMSAHPQLRGKRFERDLLWKSQLLPEVKRRLGKAKNLELKARVLLAAALGALNSTFDQWIEEEGRSNPIALMKVALEFAAPAASV